MNNKLNDTTKEAIKFYKEATAFERKGQLNEGIVSKWLDCLAVKVYQKAFRLEPNIEKIIKDEGKNNNVAVIEEKLSKLEVTDKDGKIEAEDDEGADDKEKNRYCPLTNLPIELIDLIFKIVAKIDIVSVENLGETCMLLHSRARENQLWKDAAELYHGINVKNFLNSPGNGFLNFRDIFLESPRVRFDGVYICRCTYLRSGLSEFSFNQPIHIVHYFRYLRFYKDGTVLSLLALQEPHEAIPLLKQWSSSSHNFVSNMIPNSSKNVWNKIMVGQYSLSFSEKKLMIIVTSADKNYRPDSVFYIDLVLKSSAKGSWNKLVWKDYYSVKDNNWISGITVYPIDNFKQYVFSRVRSFV